MDDEAGPEETKKPMTSAMVSEVRFLCSWAGLARESSSSKQRSQEQRTKCSTGRELERGRGCGGGMLSRSLLPKVSISGRGQDTSGHRFPKS